MKKCFFFDRDGIVNEPPVNTPYVRRWEEFCLLANFVPVLRKVRSLGYEAVIVTNQRGVAMGIMSAEEVERIHRNLRKLLMERHNLDILDILYCPHEGGTCDCQKPRPGMLLEAARRHDIDLTKSWMVGDSERDMEAGRRAGSRTIFVGAADFDQTGADYRVPDLKTLESSLPAMLR